MTKFAKTPKPPYYAVIFTNQLGNDAAGYGEMAEKMAVLASKQPGYLGIESARDTQGFGMTISYWDSLESIQRWRDNLDHAKARAMGNDRFYDHYELRIARVEKAYGGPPGKP